MRFLLSVTALTAFAAHAQYPYPSSPPSPSPTMAYPYPSDTPSSSPSPTMTAIPVPSASAMPNYKIIHFRDFGRSGVQVDPAMLTQIKRDYEWGGWGDHNYDEFVADEYPTYIRGWDNPCQGSELTTAPGLVLSRCVLIDPVPLGVSVDNQLLRIDLAAYGLARMDITCRETGLSYTDKSVFFNPPTYYLQECVGRNPDQLEFQIRFGRVYLVHQDPGQYDHLLASIIRPIRGGYLTYGSIDYYESAKIAIIERVGSVAPTNWDSFHLAYNASADYRVKVRTALDLDAFLRQPLPSSVVPFTVDTDKDGLFDAYDNSPNCANPDQFDIDADKIGDVSDPSNAPANIAALTCTRTSGTVGSALTYSCAVSLNTVGSRYRLRHGVNNGTFPLKCTYVSLYTQTYTTNGLKKTYKAYDYRCDNLVVTGASGLSYAWSGSGTSAVRVSTQNVLSTSNYEAYSKITGKLNYTLPAGTCR